MLSYRPHFIPSSIILVGAGGTGSRLMSPMAQLARTCITKFNPAAWLSQLPIFVIDGDVVEEKNLTRQNFIPKDVGKNKALVVASRYSNAFGIPIYGSPDFVTTKGGALPQFAGLPPGVNFNFNNSILILAVDSADARREILKVAFRSAGANSSSIFVIDAGNEDAFGQIKFFTNYRLGDGSLRIYDDAANPLSIPKTLPQTFQVSCIPMDIDYYANLGSSAAELSCADLNQSLAINNMMAALICSVLQNFVYVKPMTYDGIRFSLDGSMVTEYNSPRVWLKRTVSNQGEFAKYMSSITSQISGKELLIAVKASTSIYKRAGLQVTPSGDLEPIPVLVKSELSPAEVPYVHSKTSEDASVVKKTPRIRRTPASTPGVAPVVLNHTVEPPSPVPLIVIPPLNTIQAARIPRTPPVLRTGS
jgi:molybdopterin/thiamine biosynthesis adenylyltransferase